MYPFPYVKKFDGLKVCIPFSTIFLGDPHRGQSPFPPHDSFLFFFPGSPVLFLFLRRSDQVCFFRRQVSILRAPCRCVFHGSRYPSLPLSVLTPYTRFELLAPAFSFPQTETPCRIPFRCLSPSSNSWVTWFMNFFSHPECFRLRRTTATSQFFLVPRVDEFVCIFLGSRSFFVLYNPARE